MFLCKYVWLIFNTVERALEKAHLQDNTLDLLLHFHPPDSRVGDHLFVKEQTQQTEYELDKRWEVTKE